MPGSRIETDRGLTARMFFTGLLLVLLYGVLMTGLFFVFHSIAVVLVIGLAIAFAQYWFSANIALFSMQAHVVTPQEEPQLFLAMKACCASS